MKLTYSGCRHLMHGGPAGLFCRKGIDLEAFRRAGAGWPCTREPAQQRAKVAVPQCHLRQELTRAEVIAWHNQWAVAFEYTVERGEFGELSQRRAGVVAMQIPETPPARIADQNAGLRRSICSGQRFGETHVCRYPACAGEQDYCDAWDSAELRRLGSVTSGAYRP